jgi:hypothetical protein
MLTLLAPEVKTLWDGLRPVEAHELPQDLARIGDFWANRTYCGRSGRTGGGRERRGRSAAARGGPSIAMETCVRLIVRKQGSEPGYETLCRKVSDSLHLRRFCRIPLSERVSDESTLAS